MKSNELYITKSKLTEKIINQLQCQIPTKKIKKSIKEIINYLIIKISKGERIEIRRFGSFSLRIRTQYFGYNPKTKKKIHIKQKSIPFFKASKKLKKRINLSINK